MNPDVRGYDDEHIVEDCERGWRRFCAEVLVRTHYHLKALARRASKWNGRMPRCRRAREYLRREVAAYHWVFDGTGGAFSFDLVCQDIDLCPRQVQEKLRILCEGARDINLLVGSFDALEEGRNGKSCGYDPSVGRVDAGVADAVRDLRSADDFGKGRRGAQTHAICRHQDGNQDRRRSAPPR